MPESYLNTLTSMLGITHNGHTMLELNNQNAVPFANVNKEPDSNRTVSGMSMRHKNGLEKRQGARMSH